MFATALTLLGVSLPSDHVTEVRAFAMLCRTWLLCYMLSAVSVVLYWYKIRRYLYLTREGLTITQQAAVTTLLFSVVLIPKFTTLVVLHGRGGGDINNWTFAQVSNVRMHGWMDGMLM